MILIFTDKERGEFRETEHKLITSQNWTKLMAFWKSKREIFTSRTARFL